MAAVAIFSLTVSAADYEIKPTPDSRFALEIFKTGLYSGKKHLFLFERYHGTLTYDDAAPEAAKIDLTIEAASFVVKDDWLSASQAKSVREEAEGKNVLDSARFPQIRFVSSSVTRAGDGFTVQGTLTIRDAAKPAAIHVTVNGLRFEGKAEVKLKDYGIKPPGAALGMIGTRNEMNVAFTLVATPKR